MRKCPPPDPWYGHLLALAPCNAECRRSVPGRLQRCRSCLIRVSRRRRLEEPSQTEIKQLPCRVRKAFGGFEVSVNNAEIVKALQRFQNLLFDTHYFRRGHRSAF